MNTQRKLRFHSLSIWAISTWTIALLAASVSHAVFAAEDTAAQKSNAKVAAKSRSTKADAGAPNAANAKAAKQDAKSLLGISILGNQETPKALVIVPWKSSQLGDALDISKTLDDSRQPVDKEVFLRELAYYEIRSGSK